MDEFTSWYKTQSQVSYVISQNSGRIPTSGLQRQDFSIIFRDPEVAVQ